MSSAKTCGGISAPASGWPRPASPSQIVASRYAFHRRKLRRPLRLRTPGPIPSPPQRADRARTIRRASWPECARPSVAGQQCAARSKSANALVTGRLQFAARSSRAPIENGRPWSGTFCDQWRRRISPTPPCVSGSSVRQRSITLACARRVTRTPVGSSPTPLGPNAGAQHQAAPPTGRNTRRCHNGSLPAPTRPKPLAHPCCRGFGRPAPARSLAVSSSVRNTSVSSAMSIAPAPAGWATSGFRPALSAGAAAAAAFVGVFRNALGLAAIIRAISSGLRRGLKMQYAGSATDQREQDPTARSVCASVVGRGLLTPPRTRTGAGGVR